jgi:O-antigen/teichoic acid export membrane protein
MNFTAILRINLLGSVVRNGGSIGLALLGFSYYALAYGTLAGILAEFLAICYFRPTGTPWMPAFNGRLKHVFQVGVQISLSKFLQSTSQNAGDLILGRLATMKDVGMYSRGLGLILFLQSLLTNAVAPVALPHLSQVKRTGGSVADAYLYAVALVGAFALPLFAVVNIAAHPLINALFGDQWDVSVHVASNLAIWAMLQSMHCFFAHAMLTMGKERLMMIKEIISFAVKIALIILAVPYGLEMVAWGVVISGGVDLIVTSLMLNGTLGLTVRALITGFMPNIVLAALCWTTLRILSFYIDFHHINAWLALLIIGAAMVPTWMIGLKLTKNVAWPFVMGIISKFASFGPWGKQRG